MKVLNKRFALLLALVLVITMIPQGVVENVMAYDYDDYYGSYYGDDEPGEPVDNQQNIIDEAKELGVPDAFIRHFFATDYSEDKIVEPVTEPVDDEDTAEVTLNVVTSSAGKEGLEVRKVDTGVLARTKFDLGEYDFGDLTVGRLVYNMLAKKNLKGKAYLYFGDSEEAFAEIRIKRCADDNWEETRNKTIDLRDANLTGKGHIYLKFVADSALDEEGNVLPVSGKNGNLYFESMFFTEGSTPVLDFDLDNEVNTIENINNSEQHTIMGYGNMNIQIPEGYQAEYTDKELSDATYELDYIRGRGNSTWLVDKKPYKIKLDKSSDLFGMGKNKHWVLLANYYDYSLIRNRLTFYLADKLGLEYTPKSVCVDVVISGEYCGSYQLCQQVRVGKANVNIDDLEDNQATTEPEITGGYLLSMGESWLSEGEDAGTYLETADGNFRIERPEYDDNYSSEAKDVQVNYLNRYFGELEALIYSLNPDSEFDNGYEIPEGKTWRDYMDEQSYIDYYLIQEFSKNGDGYISSSTYLYKKRNGLLYWGPVWDFDFVAWAAYATNYISDRGVDGFEMADSNPWFYQLIKYDEDFKQHVIERWQVFSEILKEATADGGIIDQYKNETYYSALANYQVRSSYLADGEGYWGGDIGLVDDDGEPYNINYANEIERLKKYINARVEWMDENIDTIDEISMHANAEPVEFVVDDELYAVVHPDLEEWELKQDEIPDNPEKEGYVFKGWYYTDEEGDEVRFRRDGWPYYYDDDTDELRAYVIYAKFISLADYKEIEDIDFSTDTIYVPLEREEWEDDSEYYFWQDSEDYGVGYDGQEVDLAKYVNLKPFDADIEDLEWEVVARENADDEDVEDEVTTAEDVDDEDIDDEVATDEVVDEDINDEVVTDEVLDEDNDEVVTDEVLDEDIDDEVATDEVVDDEDIPDAFDDDDDYDFDDFVSGIHVNETGEAYVYDVGTYEVVCKKGDLEARIKIVAFDAEESNYLESFSVDENVEVKVGEYGNVNLKFEPEEYVSFYEYNYICYKSMDSDIAEVNRNGAIYGKSAGTTQVLTVQFRYDELEIKWTTVVVKADGDVEETTTPEESTTEVEPTTPGQDIAEEPATTEETSTEEVTTTVEPTTVETTTTEPTMVAPTTAEPTTTAAPTTTATPTTEPTTVAPTTAEPTTTAAPTTEEATTVTPTATESTTVAPTTNAETTVGKAKVAKAIKKKSSKKAKITLKKVKGATGYQVAIYRTKKNAKKNKKALVKKFVKKIKVTLKSKKLKNKSKLFVKARAYNVVNGKNVYGVWSKPKKMKIKK